MRGNVPAYELRNAATLTEALTLVGQDWRPFAGGTDLMVVFEAGRLAHSKYVSLHRLDELRDIVAGEHEVVIGAMATYSQIRAHVVLRSDFPMLCSAARETGAIAIQNRGTLGGNIANASPAADSPPALLVYDTELELVSAGGGSRRVPYASFHTGYKKTIMRPDELIRAVRVKRSTSGWIQHYRKVGTRKAQAISKVCFAAAARMDGEVFADVRLAYGSVAPTAVRCPRTEALLRGKKLDRALLTQARAEVAREIAPIDDIRSDREYRSRVAVNLLEEFLDGISPCGTGSGSSKN